MNSGTVLIDDFASTSMKMPSRMPIVDIGLRSVRMS
jgi:hypothetical protein